MSLTGKILALQSISFYGGSHNGDAFSHNGDYSYCRLRKKMLYLAAHFVLAKH